MFWVLQLKVLDKQGVTLKFCYFPNRCLGSLGMWPMVLLLFNAGRKLACFVLIKLVYSSGSGKNHRWTLGHSLSPSYLSSYLTIFTVHRSSSYQPNLSSSQGVFGRVRGVCKWSFWSIVSLWLLMIMRTLYIKRFRDLFAKYL